MTALHSILKRPLHFLGRWTKRLAVLAVVTAILGAIALMAAWWAFPFPVERLDRLQKMPPGPVVTDADGHVMLRLVAEDGQWRTPVTLDEVSPWLAQATVAVEDERFYRHPGVDPIAALRAAGQNIAAGRIVSGASTLTMQVCRMMDDRPRTWRAKITEALRALQLSRLRSKDRVLELYLNIAPYGGNLRGVEAASRVYFGKHTADLSVAEAALLAGLPQSPNRLRPDRHPDAARARRDHVLRRMRDLDIITADQLARALSEPICLAPRRPAEPVPHVAWLALAQRGGGGRTTISPRIQAEAERLAAEHLARGPHGDVPRWGAPRIGGDARAAVVVIDIADSTLVAMVGSGDPDDSVDGQVNGALARRSPGSALKPFVYAAAFEAGRLNPDATVYDVPIRRAGWMPENFDRTFRGPVPAGEALRRSLNVPAILVAEGTGLDRCLGAIEAAGVSLPPDARRRGGLAVAVGALEVTLLDLTNAYATIGRRGLRRNVRLFADQAAPAVRALDPNACAALDEILSSRSPHAPRPAGLEYLADRDMPWFMWKTGTSAGRRDAWAVGHNRRFAVGVWAGRFSGTGRVEFVGHQAAEPLLAALFLSPGLRTLEAPPPAAPIVVRHPLPRPAPVAEAVRILAPSEGDIFLGVPAAIHCGGGPLAPLGRAIVHAQANRHEGVYWFLNGRSIPDTEARRLSLAPGTYELRCVTDDGSSSAVRFRVR